ncbi:hypothetical protein CCMA1212_010301 [Trichoderma ghanense]|uniref:Uncharacterized protein n=1 Tax=Trichoderma ghanense TaxID=65468 RepID=A0ABY2GQD1_9HYPO
MHRHSSTAMSRVRTYARSLALPGTLTDSPDTCHISNFTFIHLTIYIVALAIAIALPLSGHVLGMLNFFVQFKQHVDSAIHSIFFTSPSQPQAQQHQPQPPPDIRQSDLSTSPSPDTPDTPACDSSRPRHARNNHSQTPPPVPPVTMDDPNSRPLALDTVSVASWSYSPLNLRHLKQPVPNDLPPQCDPSVFTFEDAFEDLLAVSQGRPLPDIKDRYNQRQLLRQMFSNGEPTWFWLRRLESQGLLRRPTRDELYRPRNFGLLEDDDDAGGAEWGLTRSGWSDWSRLHEELDRKAAEVWSRAASSEKAQNGQPHGNSFFDEVHQVFKQLEDSFHGRNRPHKEDHEGPHQKSLPDHFDDLFSSLSSSFAEGHKTWDAFVKSITESTTKTDNKPVSTDITPVAASLPPRTSEEKVYDNGIKEVVTRDEKVNSFGYLTTTVTKKTYDKNGNEIGTETHFTMRPADRTHKVDAGGSSDANVIERADTDADDQQAQDKKSGWFWK